MILVREAASVGAGPVPARCPARGNVHVVFTLDVALSGHRAGTGPAPTTDCSTQFRQEKWHKKQNIRPEKWHKGQNIRPEKWQSIWLLY